MAQIKLKELNQNPLCLGIGGFDIVVWGVGCPRIFSMRDLSSESLLKS